MRRDRLPRFVAVSLVVLLLTAIALPGQAAQSREQTRVPQTQTRASAATPAAGNYVK